MLHAGESVRRRHGVPKICGSDVELGNFVNGASGATSHDAARMLLREIPGHARRFAEHDWHPANSWSGYRYGTTLLGASEAVPLMAPVGDAEGLTDWGRKFLPGNGGSVYIDLGHLELATPECRSARDHVAWSRAMLLIARRAAERANAGRGDGGRVTVLANNSDTHALYRLMRKLGMKIKPSDM